LQDLWPSIRVKRYRPSIFKGGQNEQGFVSEIFVSKCTLK